MKSAARHAVYWTPARDHPLWTAGCLWLGRDPEAVSRFTTPRTTPRASRRAPAHYGFHATLKAPMHLRDGDQEVEYLAAVRAIAATSKPFPMPPLEVGRLSRFIALRPVDAIAAGHPLRLLADRCVTELDRFRAPFDDREWAIRSKGLDATAQDLLRRLGYHYVLDRWRFHMTLSDSFAQDASAATIEAAMLDEARRHFGDALTASLTASEIAVFVEENGEPFRLTHRFELEG